MSAKSQKLITVKIGAQKFAISVFAVRDMLRPQPTLSVPLAPAHVAGLLNLKGKLTTVLDLRIRFGASVSEAGILVVVEDHQEQVALVVDSVVDVIALNAEEIAKPAATINPDYRSLVTGSFGDTLILDLASTLA